MLVFDYRNSSFPTIFYDFLDILKNNIVTILEKQKDMSQISQR